MFFEEQRRLNRELSLLGNTLMALSFDRVIHDDTLLPDHPTMQGFRTDMSESELLCGQLPKRISVSEHHDAYGNRYLMVLNRDWNTDVDVCLKLKDAANVYEVSKQDGKQNLVMQDTVCLQAHIAPGDLMLYRIQPATEAPFTAEYYLEK